MKIANIDNSAVQMVKKSLERIKCCENYNIFTAVFEESALEKAKKIDDDIKNGRPVGRLAGVPFALKDNFLYHEGATTASAHILDSFDSPFDGTMVRQLEAEGAICVGKTNLDAFAHGSSTENSFFGPTLNAFDTARVAGGSSGGSAVAVALDCVQFATGSDTGGSIRQPASLNGVFGLKPTYGATSRYGVVAMASSTDSMGFFTKSAEDLDLLMSICAHQDPKDMTTLPDFYDGTTDQVKRIGIVKDFDSDTVSEEIRSALKATVETLKNQGYEIVPLDMPTLKYALAVYYILVPAEVASNLSRYDGIRYGLRSDSAHNLDDIYKNTRKEGFMPENKRRIMIGNFVLSSGFFDAYFLKAAKVRTLIIKEYKKAFERCDLILTPVSPTPAFRLGEKVSDPVSMYLEDVMSVPINLAGLPALSIPVGTTADFTKTSAENSVEIPSEISQKSPDATNKPLPINLQLVGPRRSDKTIIDFAKNIARVPKTPEIEEQK